MCMYVCVRVKKGSYMDYRNVDRLLHYGLVAMSSCSVATPVARLTIN